MMKAAAETSPADSTRFGDIVGYYDAAASELAAEYEALTFEHVHSPILDFLPEEPALLLDIGAGSGRDAAALAERGYDVFAVEPSREFRKIGRRLHPSPRIIWLEDKLPCLKQLVDMNSEFDAILCSAVWMHLSDRKQKRGMCRLAELLKPGGRLFITFRTRITNDRPGIFDTTAEDVILQAKDAGLTLLCKASLPDAFRRPAVSWFSLTFENSV